MGEKGSTRRADDTAWLAAVTAASADPMVVLDADGVLLYANGAIEQALGVVAEEWVGEDAFGFVHPDDLELAAESLAVMIETTDRPGNALDLRLRRGDGSYRTMEMIGTNLLDDPLVGGIVLSFRDTTKRRAAEKGRAAAEQLLQHTFDTNPTGLALCTLEGRFVKVNQAMCRMVGLSESTLMADTYQGRTDATEIEAEAELFAALLAGEMESYTVEKRVTRPDGGVTWGEMTVSLVADPVSGDQLVFGQLRDISEERLLRDELVARGLQDPLTGLANRALLQDRVGHALEQQRRGGVGFALLFIDLDDFKAVNDALGHAAGDFLLREIGERLRERFRAVDTVARIGGDEFAVLVEELEHEGDATDRCDEVLEIVSRPIEIDGRELIIDASIGLTTVPPGVDEKRERGPLLADADLAMYSAKVAGKRAWRRFEPGMRSAAADRLAVREALRSADIEGSVELYYQPVVELATGIVIGLEALVRWRHPLRGLLSPAQFMVAAEETGASVQFGRQVREVITEHRVRWIETGSGLAALPVGVKVSARELRDPTLVDRFGELMQSGLFPDGHLVVEVSESAIDSDSDRAVSTIGALHDLGVNVSLDDFGAGRWSIAYLDRLQVDYLMLAGRLQSDLLRDDRGDRMLRGVVALCREIGIEPVALGVEDPQQRDRLTALGVTFGQGYLFSRPLPVDPLEAGIGASLSEASAVALP